MFGFGKKTSDEKTVAEALEAVTFSDTIEDMLKQSKL